MCYSFKYLKHLGIFSRNLKYQIHSKTIFCHTYRQGFEKQLNFVFFVCFRLHDTPLISRIDLKIFRYSNILDYALLKSLESTLLQDFSVLTLTSDFTM